MKLYIYIVYVSILHMPRTQQVATLSEAAELKLWSLKRGQPETDSTTEASGFPLWIGFVEGNI